MNDFSAGTSFHSSTFSKVGGGGTSYDLNGNGIALGMGSIVGNDDVGGKIYGKTNGNPLLVSQLVHVLCAEERLRSQDVATSTLVGDETMRAAILQHIAPLPESVVHVLTVASVFGHSFALTTGDVDRAVLASLRAVELAERASNPKAAAKYAERGLEALRYARRPNADHRARLLAAASPLDESAP